MINTFNIAEKIVSIIDSNIHKFIDEYYLNKFKDSNKIIENLEAEAEKLKTIKKAQSSDPDA